MAKKALPFRIDEDLLRRVDEARGDVPRTRWVTRAIEAALAEKPSKHIPGFGSVPADVDTKALTARMERRVANASVRALERQRKLNEARSGR